MHTGYKQGRPSFAGCSSCCSCTGFPASGWLLGIVLEERRAKDDWVDLIDKLVWCASDPCFVSYGRLKSSAKTTTHNTRPPKFQLIACVSPSPSGPSSGGECKQKQHPQTTTRIRAGEVAISTKVMRMVRHVLAHKLIWSRSSQLNYSSDTRPPPVADSLPRRRNSSE